MKHTLMLAANAANKGEVPVAAIIVDQHTRSIIAESTNLVEESNNSTSHAELLSINKALAKLKSKFCLNTEIYINLQPCQMCYSAICIARIPKIYFAAYDMYNGYLYHHPRLYKPEIYGGIMETAAQKIIKNFFKNIR